MSVWRKLGAAFGASLLLVGCSSGDLRLVTSASRDFSGSKIRRVAILPARLSGQGVSPMEELLAERIHASLFGRSRWEVVPTIEVEAEIVRLRSKNVSPGEWHARLGSFLLADSVLFGEILFVRERVGSDYGAETPASIHFVISLVDVARNKMMWRAEFQETQQSLTQNLFFFSDFFSRGGKWLTARELLEIGVEKAVKSLLASMAEEA